MSQADQVWDVVVVGAGIAGWTAALRATQSGARSLLLDKAPGDLGGGNTLMTSGSFNCAGLPPTTPADRLCERVMSQRVATADLARSWAQTCARADEWLREVGVEITVDDGTGQHWLEQQSRPSFAPLYRRDVGTNVLTKLRAAFLAAGGAFWPATRALELHAARPGVVDGLIVQREGDREEIRAGAVVLAAGGFSANPELLTRYVGPLAGECKLRGSARSTGDGLRLAQAIGAGAMNLAYFYGHLQALRALEDDHFWPYPRFDDLIAKGILVDRAGRRFVDESRGDVAISNVLARGSDPRGAALVFDERAWQESAQKPAHAAGLPGPNPWLVEQNGGLCQADDAAGLAAQLGLDVACFTHTVETFNRAAEVGGGGGLDVPRSAMPRALRPPYLGLRVVPGVTFTMGGVRIDGQARVTSAEGDPITGLFAAGDTIGGLMGGYDGGYTGGLSQAVVTGLLAGESAAHSSRTSS